MKKNSSDTIHNLKGEPVILSDVITSVKYQVMNLENVTGKRVNPFEGESCSKCNTTKLEGTLEERRCLECGFHWKV